jgi:hypothetical protein
MNTKLLDRLVGDEERRASGLQQLEHVKRQRSHNRRRRKAVASKILTAATLEKERLCGGVGGLGRGTNPLDSFFPFDPYLLRRSHDFVEPIYKHWTGTVDADVEADSNDDDDAMMEGEEVEQNDGDDSSSSTDEEDDDDVDEEDSDDDDHNMVHAKERALSTGSDAVQPMSFASNVSGMADYEAHQHVSSNDIVVFESESHREAWAETMKRDRAPSIENGSW